MFWQVNSKQSTLVWIVWTFLHSYFHLHCSLLFLFLSSNSSWQDLDCVFVFWIYYLEIVIMIQPLLCVSSVCFSSVKIYLRKSNTLFVLFHIDKMSGINYDMNVSRQIKSVLKNFKQQKKIWSGSVFVCFCEMLVPFVMCISDILMNFTDVWIYLSLFLSVNKQCELYGAAAYVRNNNFCFGLCKNTAMF